MRTDPRGANVNIEYGRHLVHAGKLAFASDGNTGVTSVTYLLVTGALPCSLMMRIQSSTAGNIVLTEGVAATAGSALPLTPFNRADNPATKKPLSVLTKTPTAVTGGVALPAEYFQAGIPQIIPGLSPGAVFLLAPNTKYLITETLASGNIQNEFEVYEDGI